MYKLNTGAINQYDDSKDEFLKTAPSLNLGASAFNSLQNSYKNINTSVSSSYNFNPTIKSTTDNYQSQTYYNPTTIQTQNYFSPSTAKPYQQDYYTTPKAQSPDVYKQNFYSPQTQQTTIKNNNQFSQTTQIPYQQQQYTYSTESTYTQYNPTTQNPFQNQYNQQTQTTKKPVQQYNNQAVQQTFSTQPPSNQQAYFQPQRNTPAHQLIQPQKNTPAQQIFKQTQLNQKGHPQRNPTHQQITNNNYYSSTTLKPFLVSKATSQPRGTRPTTLDSTERPRPFTQDTITHKDQKKEKEQYDYAYYDDGTQSEYDNIEPVEDFSRTKSKN